MGVENYISYYYLDGLSQVHKWMSSATQTNKLMEGPGGESHPYGS